MRRIVFARRCRVARRMYGASAAARAREAAAGRGLPQVRSNLIGMSAGELIQRMGQPALQVREGPGLKLQFRGRSCILDAYLIRRLMVRAQSVSPMSIRGLENGTTRLSLPASPR